NNCYQRAPITIDDGEGRVVKREVKEEVHPIVDDSKEKLEKSEIKVQKLIKIAGEKQSRIEYLE
ncbi:hypothetical protein PMAYCL1PPCAC_01568, partial [Pristionchus mayeri]